MFCVPQKNVELNQLSAFILKKANIYLLTLTQLLAFGIILPIELGTKIFNCRFKLTEKN